jgi:hypothetical protein
MLLWMHYKTLSFFGGLTKEIVLRTWGASILLCCSFPGSEILNLWFVFGFYGSQRFCFSGWESLVLVVWFCFS